MTQPTLTLIAKTITDVDAAYRRFELVERSYVHDDAGFGQEQYQRALADLSVAVMNLSALLPRLRSSLELVG